MESERLDAVKQRVRRAYELDRLRRAAAGFAPMLLMIGVASVIVGRYAVSMPAGVLLFAGGVLALWFGRDLGRGVLPGVIGGSLALVLALFATHMGHPCTGERCLSWCLPVCLVGGALAGGIVSFAGFKQQRGSGYWVSASGTTLLTGALGCDCVGFAGIGGLVIGFVGALFVGTLSSLVRRPAGS